MLALNDVMTQLDRADNMCWYGHVVRLEECCALSRTLGIEEEGKRSSRLHHSTDRMLAGENKASPALSEKVVVQYLFNYVSFRFILCSLMVNISMHFV